MVYASFTIPEKRTPLTEEMQNEIKKMIGEVVQAKELKEASPVKIFISFYESKENICFVEKLLDPFLTELSFEVHYWIKDRKFGNPNNIIYNIIDNCDIIIGLYTNDDKIEGKDEYRSAGNVVREMGRDKPKNKVILCEEGTKIETMSFSEIPSIKFTRNKYDKLLLDLLHFLNNSYMIKIKTSIQ
jgi:hypothetical protein